MIKFQIIWNPLARLEYLAASNQCSINDSEKSFFQNLHLFLKKPWNMRNKNICFHIQPYETNLQLPDIYLIQLKITKK